ncbi:B3 domain-containing transcription factor VRN1-like [Abrus precatorius]|uniref:B3 domain-containing transcription factor VRN1-like n=1 Tax=Abrus precatorius TaxID=3816 RepID=A0A8B8M1S9_ABRPR|nr:B3 domain-containing transcription factor VRN1-like [Abrus precatorius]
MEHGGNLPNPLFLKPPDDTKWEVHWTKHDGAIWLEKGWKEFATYYTLSHGHLIVFEYQETFHLEVHIFDQSCLEIKYPFHDTQNDHDSFVHVTNDTVKILEEVTPTQNNKLISPISISCPPPSKKLRTTTSGVVGSSSNLQQMTQYVQIHSNKTQGTNFQESTLASVGEVLDGNVNENPKMEQLTSKINAALNEAATFKSNNPSCTVVLKPSYVFGRSLFKEMDLIAYTLRESHILEAELLFLKKIIYNCHALGRWKETEKTSQSSSPQSFTNGAMKEAKMFTSENPYFRFKIKSDHKRDYRPVVPIAFMRDYFSNKKTVMLQLGNKLWPVSLLRSMGVPTKLSKGWALFEKESKLLVGDVCIFELINIEDAVFYVHIFRGQP